MISESIKVEIDRLIKEIWLNDICEDYRRGNLIREASLQSSLYHHIRNRFGSYLEKHSLYVYPEFYFRELKFRADLVIAEMDMDKKTQWLSERVTDIAAIIELKYDGGYAASTENWIKSDKERLRIYAKKLKYNCQYYWGVIYETECTWLHWFDKRSTNTWGKGRLTELNAGLLSGQMTFEINSYNNMNKNLHKAKKECTPV